MNRARRVREKWFAAVLLVSRLFLGGVFLFSGVTKILEPGGFALSIYHYQLLPDLLVNPAAIILPWVEVVCGMALILRWWVGGASLVVTALLLVFLMALAITLVRGLDISCGCFSSTGEGKISWWYLLRDFSLFAMGILILLFHDRETGGPPAEA